MIVRTHVKKKLMKQKERMKGTINLHSEQKALQMDGKKERKKERKKDKEKLKIEQS